MDSIFRIERVKRAARLNEKYGDDHAGAVLTIVRASPRALKVSDAGNDVRFVAMSEAIDVDDEVVVASGVRPDSYFFRNRSVFLDHHYDFDSLIGKARHWTGRPTTGKPTMWEVAVKLVKEHRHTPAVMSLAREGLVGSSIGFARIAGGKPTEDETKRYTKGGRSPSIITREWEWIELSITAIPANVEAQAIGTDGWEDAKSATLDELVRKGRCPRDLAVMLGLPEKPARSLYPTVEKRRPVLNIIVGGGS